MPASSVTAPGDDNDLLEEAKQLERMLRNLQRGITYDLLADDGFGSSRREYEGELAANEAQRRAVAKASWAKSGTKRQLPGSSRQACESRQQGGSNPSLDVDLVRAEKSVKKRAAAFSIGRAARDDLLTVRVASDAMYDPANLDAVSTKKRSKGVIFTTERRRSTVGPSDEVKEDVVEGGQTSSSRTKPRSERLVERQPPSYSFPKTPRVWDKKTEAGGQGEAHSEGLDRERGERYLTPAPPTAIMRPPHYAPSDPELGRAEDRMQEQEKESEEQVARREPPVLHVLSTHARTPGVSIRPPTPVRGEKVEIFGPAVPSPGPGAYNLDAAMPGIAANPAGRGRVYHAESKRSYTALLLAAEQEAATPGVGQYDIEGSRRVKGGIFMRAPDKQPTPHQLRKKYWEDKAEGLREDKDDMAVASDALLRPRTPNVTLAPQKETDWQRRMIARKRLQERIREAAGSDYDVRRSLVEPRARAPAVMAAQAAAQASTRRRLEEKPMVMAALADKRAAAAAAGNRFYGPQLQVAWAPPSGGQPASQQEGDSGEESPTEEVSRLLARRSRGAGTSREQEEEEATAAYLRSSLAAPTARAAVIMRPPSESISRAALIHPPPAPVAFLGPQLPTDWLAESEARTATHKNHAIKMDLGVGREAVQIKQKGEVRVEAFDDSLRPTDPLGPGRYDPAGPVIGENVRGAVPFRQLVSRSDAVGPEGERPDGAGGDIGDIAGETFLDRDRLDIEYGAAKDAAQRSTKKGLTLHVRERHAPAAEASASDGPEHLGGSWFEGMALEAAKRNPVVRMDLMKGRSVTEAENEALMQEVTGVEAPGLVQIEVRDWKPGMPKAPAARAFPDAKTFPRFEEVKKIEGGKEDLVEETHFATEASKRPGPIMSRMAGRGDGEVAATPLLDGEVDLDAALALAHARAAAIKRGEEATNMKLKKTPFHADMGKQKGREESPASLRAAAEAAARAEREASQPPPKAFGQAARGAVGFSKISGGVDKDEEEGVLRAAGLLQQEELDLVPEQVVKKPAPAARMGDPAKQGRFDKEKKSAAADLDYGDVDAGKVAGKALGAKKGGRTMGNAVGRPAANEDKALAELGLDGQEEQLQITPDDRAVQKPVKGGKMGSAGLAPIKPKAPKKKESVDEAPLSPALNLAPPAPTAREPTTPLGVKELKDKLEVLEV